MRPVIEIENLGIKFNVKQSRRRAVKLTLKKVLATENDADTRHQGASAFWALRNITFSIGQGDILGVVGSNGSGKSTLLRAISGVYTPDEGQVTVNGTISPLLSLGTGFKMNLSGYENIFLNGIIMGFSQKEIQAQFKHIVEFSELGQFIHRPVVNYSSGMRARLGFSIAAFLQRDIMLIDEVLGVGDFRFRKKSQDKMREIIKSGQTVVIVSHNLESIREYATKAVWINQGKFMQFGGVGEVLDGYLKS